MLPTIPHLPAPIPSLDADFGEYMSRALSMINNTPQLNLTGHPAISVPCGVSDDLPIGCQIVGRHFDDLTVLKVADALENERGLAERVALVRSGTPCGRPELRR